MYSPATTPVPLFHFLNNLRMHKASKGIVLSALKGIAYQNRGAKVINFCEYSKYRFCDFLCAVLLCCCITECYKNTVYQHFFNRALL